ncbi:MAG: MATE family efflux transporter [Oscillospiraceae bacterium]|nr:MATE family efflux transporter [Oscillospiraceae bacterium]
MTKTTDLTAGKASKTLLAFYFPMLLTNLLQQIYTFADTAIVGRALGDNALAAVGNMSAPILLIIGFVQGITNGFSVIIAQRCGSGSKSAVRRAVAASISLSTVLSLPITVISLMFLKKMLVFMHTEPIILGDSLVYGYIIFGGVIITMAYNLCSCILRAMGDSKTPFIAIIVSSALNIFLDCLFVFMFKTGVGGTAAATVSAQAVSVIICISRIFGSDDLRLCRKDFKDNFTLQLALLKNGIPMACMNSITAAGCIPVQSQINALGAVYTSAYSVGSKYINLFMLPSVTAGFAVSAFTGQNMGANHYSRIKDGVRTGAAIAVVSYIILGTAMVFFPEPLAKIMLSGQETVALAAGFLRICGKALIILNMLFIFRSAVQGMGKPIIPMFSGFLEMALRIAVILLCIPKIGFSAAAYAEIVAWTGALVLNFAAYRNVMGKYKGV